MTLVCSIDGHPLEIKKLRGEEPVESIDLSSKGLTELSATIIASLVSSNTATKSLKYAAADFLLSAPPDGGCPFACSFPPSLNNNQLCGLDRLGRGTYTADGIIAIAEMLKLNTTLQSIRCASRARFCISVSTR